MTNLFPQRYVNRSFKIPFHDASSNEFKLKLKFNRQEGFASKVEKASRHYLDHFFPEFYRYRIDPEYYDEPSRAADGSQTDVARIEAIMQEVKNSIDIAARFGTSPPSGRQVNVFTTSYDFMAIRMQLESEGKMPSYEAALSFFREQKNLSEPRSETTLVIAALGTTNNAFNDGMSAYNRQLQGFEGQLNINVDFNFLQTDVQKILNTLVSDLVYTLRRTGTSAAFTEADTLTIQFGLVDERKPAVVGIEHLLVEQSIASEPAKIGVFTNILYNRVFQDPLSLATLKNYQNIVESVQDGPLEASALQQMFATSGSMGGTFLDFLESPDTIETLANPPTIMDTDTFDPTFNLGQTPVTGSANDFQNVFIQVAYEEGLLSPANLKSLENGFQEFFSSEEMQKIKAQISQNPKLYARVFQKTKAKTLTKARKVVSVVNNILLTGPMGFLDQKNPVIGRLFRSLGIDQLIKEVMLCATFGLNYEASRITTAIGNSLQQEAASIGGSSALSGLNTFDSIYNEPELPQPGGIVEIPAIDWNLLKPKLKDGDIAKLIKNVLVDTMQELALSMIQMLSEILREKCEFNNPNTQDYGAIDIAALLPPPNTTITGIESQLDQLAATYNLSTEDLRTYLRELSNIVSSVGVCTLFTARDTASPELVAAIIEYNETYPNEFIQSGLTSPSSLMGFFARLSEFVDVTDICEEIANTVYALNQDNVCLIFDDADLLDELLDRIQMPDINLDCPDQANYINDPTITVAIPETFNGLVESVEVKFINAASSLKDVLLEPVLIRGSDSNVLSSAASTAELGRDVNSTGSLESIDPNILNRILTVFDNIGDVAEDINEFFETCEVNPAQVLGFDAAQAVQGTATAIEVLTDAVQDPGFKQAIQGINTKLEEISQFGTEGENAGAPAVTTYKFNQQFTRAFRNYVNPRAGTYIDAPSEYPYTAPMYFDSRRIASTDTYRSLQAAQEAASGYTPIELKFSFPTNLPGVTSRAMTGPKEYITVTYPRFGADTNIDFNYVSDSNLILDDMLISSFTGVDDAYVDNFEDESPPQFTNVYVDKFVQAYFDSPLIQEKFLQGTEAEQLEYRNDVEAHEFPKANAALVESIIQYIVDNGIFDAATLQSLNLFHLNTNCPAEEVADFLDVQGIIDQMTREYAEAACNDSGVPMRNKIRDLIKFGLYLLLIQIHIAEFIIKNIFVFSAFTFESLLEDRSNYLFRFFRSQVLSGVIGYLDSENVEVADENIYRLQLAEYFNRKVRRPAVANNGGIRFTQSPNDIAFAPDTSFSATDTSPLPGFDEIIDYLIVERLNYARIPINNAIKKALPDTNPIGLDKMLVSSLPLLSSTNEEGNPPQDDASIAAAAQIAFYDDPTVFLCSRVFAPPTQNLATGYRRIYSLWFYDGQTQKVLGPSGETLESGAAQEDRFGSGDVVMLLDNLYSESTSQPLRYAGQEVVEPTLDCVDRVRRELIESFGGHVPEHRRCPEPAPRVNPSNITTLQRFNAGLPEEGYEVSELSILNSAVDDGEQVSDISRFSNGEIVRHRASNPLDGFTNNLQYFDDSAAGNLDMGEYEAMEIAQRNLRLRAGGIFENLVVYNAQPLFLIQRVIGNNTLESVGWMYNAVVDGDVSFLQEISAQEEEENSAFRSKHSEDEVNPRAFRSKHGDDDDSSNQFQVQETED
jgi:hypothetical protein